MMYILISTLTTANSNNINGDINNKISKSDAKHGNKE